MFELRRNPPLTDTDLNRLFHSAWPDHENRSFAPVLERSLAWVAAYSEERLVGFVNVAWDGGLHGFLLDTTVHPGYRRRGVAVALLNEAAKAAAEHDLEWLHVDFEPHLEPLYRKAGYRHTEAGLLRLRPKDA